MRISVSTKMAQNAAVALTVVMHGLASAHHSQAAFDHDTVVTLFGDVSRYEWRNPHVYIYIKVGDDGDGAREWQVEADPTPLMSRNGWTSDTLTPGDSVIVRAYPDNTRERNHALLISLTTPDGVILTPRASGSVSSAEAADIAGVWDGLRGFTTRRVSLGSLTEKAVAARAAYEESQNPVRDCRAYTTPGLMTLPYLTEIVRRDDRVLIRTEFFKVERTIYMDGRGHPVNGERTNQGHSIGSWDGDTLVVDTALFTPHPRGLWGGIPSGDNKHVVERLARSEDRTRLLIDFTVEDPEYLTSPLTGTMEWDYAPNRNLLSFDCEPDNAQQFAID